MYKQRKEINYLSMIAENLSTLKIHKLTQAQYDRELKNGNIDANALYLTPHNEIHNHRGQSINPYAIELCGSSSQGHGGYIDFHYGETTEDYTSRIEEAENGILSWKAGMKLDSSTYGDTLPEAGIVGRIFFKVVG